MSTTTTPRVGSEPVDDRTLVLGILCGDVTAQRRLFERYQEKILRFFRHRSGSDDFEDLAQDVWRVVLDRAYLERIRDLETSVRAYIYGIARNILYSYYRARERSFDPLTSSLAVFDATLSRQVAELYDAARLREALNHLSVESRALLELRYEEGMNTRELANVFCVPVGTIKRRLFTAREKLNALMQSGERAPKKGRD